MRAKFNETSTYIHGHNYTSMMHNVKFFRSKKKGDKSDILIVVVVVVDIVFL